MTLTLSIAARYALRELNPWPSEIVPAGRVLFWRGRTRLGFGELANIAPHMIPRGTDNVALARADYRAVMGEADG